MCTYDGVAQLAIDTIGQLDSVTVSAKAVTPLGHPSKIKHENWQTGKLATSSTEALLYLPGVHIRQQGPGQISTLQYRGLQGARVAQTWQGLPVTNPQIGTSDVHELNLGLVDQVEIGSPTYLGNAAAISVKQSAEGQTSLSTRYAQGNGFLVNGQWKGLRVIFQNDQHRFSHFGRSVWGEEITVKNPRINTHSIGASYMFNFGKNWSSSSYFLTSDRRYTIEIFSDLGGTFEGESNLKTSAGRQLFTYATNSGKERVDLGVFYDRLLYKSEYGSSSEGQTIQPLIKYQVKGEKGLLFTTDNRILFSKHKNYEESTVRPETRTLINYSKKAVGINIDWTAGLHARLNSGTIFFGTLSIIKKISAIENVQFELKRIARLPSLDDQLWQNSGVEDLSPEQGWGISTSSRGTLGPLIISPVLFARRFSDYILWLPRGNFWTPNSIPDVNNYGAGLDISGRVGSNFKNLSYSGSLNYSELTLAKDYQLPTRRLFLEASSNLPFSPKFTSNLSLDYSHNDWSILVQARYTGKQFSAYNGLAEYDDFAVLRSAISYQLSLASLSLSCDNITNTIIPNDFNLFSPLRRFELTVNYTPNKNK